MKHLFLILFTFSLLCEVCAQANPDDHVFIKKVNIVDVKTGKILPDMDIILKANIISDIQNHQGSSFKKFEGIVIDGTGKFLIPGLWDMHTHIFWDWGPQMLIANGVTGVRVMHGGERIKDIRENRRNGRYKGLELSYSSPIVDGSSMWAGALEVHTPEEGRRIVRKQAAAGYDFIKVYSFLDRETYFAIADECRKQKIAFAGHVPVEVKLEEAIDAGQKSTEHNTGLFLYCSSQRDHFYTVAKGEKKDTTIIDGSIRSSFYKIANFQVTTFDESRLEPLGKLLGESDFWLCPTLVNSRAAAMKNDPVFVADARKYYLPKEELEFWESPDEYPEEFKIKESENIKIWQEFYRINRAMMKPLLNGGAKFLAGTDVGNPYIYPGFSLHDELELMVETGFSPLQALQTATLNPAIYLGRLDELGTVEQGKRADLVLLDANPLEDINHTRKIRAVMIGGKLYDRNGLDMLLEEAKNFRSEK